MTKVNYNDFTLKWPQKINKKLSSGKMFKACISKDFHYSNEYIRLEIYEYV